MFRSVTRVAKGLRAEVLTLYFIARDPRTPLIAKWIAAAVAAYALSPIDLIPDFIPIFGHLDDLIVIPAGLWLALHLTPPEIVDEARAKALKHEGKVKTAVGTVVLTMILLFAAFLIGAIWLIRSLVERL